MQEVLSGLNHGKIVIKYLWDYIKNVKMNFIREIRVGRVLLMRKWTDSAHIEVSRQLSSISAIADIDSKKYIK